MTPAQAGVLPQRKIQPGKVALLGGGIALILLTPALPFLFNQTKHFFAGVTPALEKPAVTVKVKVAEPVIQKPAESNMETVAIRLKTLDLAAKNLQAQIKKAPEDISLQNQLGLIYMNLGELEQAQTEFTQCIQLGKMELENTFQAAETAREAGRLKEAASLVLLGAKLTSELATAHSNLARIHEAKGDQQLVLAELNAIQKEADMFKNAHSARDTVVVTNQAIPKAAIEHLARAEMLYNIQDYQNAAKEYKAILELAPGLALAHDRLGMIHAKAHQMPEAITEWELASKCDPKSANIHNNLGMAYYSVGMPEEALAAFQQAQKLNPHSAEAALNMANLYSSQGDYLAARRVIETACQHNPHNAAIFNDLGTLLALTGKQSEAMKAFQKALALDPGLATAHYGLGNIFLAKKHYLSALKEFRQALALNPQMHQAQAKIEEITVKNQRNISS